MIEAAIALFVVDLIGAAMLFAWSRSVSTLVAGIQARHAEELKAVRDECRTDKQQQAEAMGKLMESHTSAVSRLTIAHQVRIQNTPQVVVEREPVSMGGAASARIGRNESTAPAPKPEPIVMAEFEAGSDDFERLGHFANHQAG